MPQSSNKSIFSSLDAAAIGDNRGSRTAHFEDRIEQAARGSAHGLPVRHIEAIGAEPRAALSMSR